MPRTLEAPSPERASFSEEVWGAVDNEAINEVKEIVEELRGEVREVRTAIKGDDLGSRGILERVQDVEKEQDRLERLVEAFERNEERREEETAAREKKRERFQVWMYGLVGTTLAGIVVSLVTTYLTSGFGGG